MQSVGLLVCQSMQRENQEHEVAQWFTFYYYYYIVFIDL